MKEHTFGKTPAVTDLPTDLLREIGAFLVTFAHLEWLLTKFAYAILGVDATEGRIAVREPRAPERFDMVCDLLSHRSLESDADLISIRKEIEDCENWRNLIAHAIWVRDPVFGALRLVKTTGQWQPTKDHPPKTKRRVAPEGVRFDLPDASALNEKLQSVVGAVERWIEEFRKPEPSQ